MKRYKKYEFIENTNNKELNNLFENPSYEEIEKMNNRSNEEGYADINSIDIIAIIAVIGMIISFLVSRVVS